MLTINCGQTLLENVCRPERRCFAVDERPERNIGCARDVSSPRTITIVNSVEVVCRERVDHTCPSSINCGQHIFFCCSGFEPSHADRDVAAFCRYWPCFERSTRGHPTLYAAVQNGNVDPHVMQRPPRPGAPHRS